VYYAQRSTNQGLLISEATDVMPAISEYGFFISLKVLPSYCFTSLCTLNYWCQTTGREEHFPSCRISCGFVLQEIFGVLGHMSL
jgi:hypothetical protein